MTLDIQDSPAFVVDGKAFTDRSAAEKYVEYKTSQNHADAYLNALKSAKFPERSVAISERILKEFADYIYTGGLPARREKKETSPSLTNRGKK